jgi:hypothetical protein
MKNPIQPVFLDNIGVLRFKENSVIAYLLEVATEEGYGLYHIAARGFSPDDLSQFWQLIGYSVSGFNDLSSTTDKMRNRVEKKVDKYRMKVGK